MSEDQAGYVLELIRTGEREGLKRVVAKLPNNPFLKEIIAGIQTVLEESLEKNLQACAETIQKEMAK